MPDTIEDIEADIHSIHDKYFHSEDVLSLVAGVSSYSLPSDIYATKITGIFFDDGATKYEIKPMKDLSEIPYIKENDFYKYRITNTATDGLKIKLYPASRDTSSTIVTIFYRRAAKRFSADTDILDVPEAKQFVKQYVLDQVANKERMTPDAPESEALKRKRKLLMDSLERMIDDDNNEIFIDMSFFEECV